MLNYEQKITETLLDKRQKRTTKNKQSELLLKEIKERCTPKEKEILTQFFLEGKKLAQLCSKNGRIVKRQTLYQKIYRLRKDVRAEYNKSKGLRASKDIVSYKLHNNILNFVKKYKQCLEERSFNSMNGYFKEIGIPDRVPRLNITKIIDYDIMLTGKNCYELAVHYEDNHKELDCFFTEFKVRNNKNIIIKKLPANRNMYIYEIDESAVPKDLMDKLKQTDREGFGCVKKKEIDELIKKADKSKIKVKDSRPKKKIRVKT